VPELRQADPNPGRGGPAEEEGVKYLSVCSGIEAASVAWHQLGWEPVGFSEIEKFPSQVLATRFPGVKNYGDMTRFKEWGIEPGSIDVLVGGTPCQAFSVAGLRRGLDDPRGNLALVFVAMVDWFRPEWVVWENVPGVLSSSGGRDFGAFLGALGELGYGWSYRVLDAQYFGVAQRRRRVFVVAHSSGDARRAAEVLFEPSCLRGDPPPRREAGQGVAGCITPGIGNRLDGEFDTFQIETHGSLYESHPQDSRITGPVDQSPTVAAKWGTGGNNTPLVQQPMAMRESGQGYWMQDEVIGTIRAEGENRPSRPSNVVAVQQPTTQYGPIAGSLLHRHDSSPCADRGENVVAIQQPMAFQSRASATNSMNPSVVVPTLDKGKAEGAAIFSSMAVRRLTPVECERLQGFPDGWTDIKPGGKDTPDSPRYKALGNSMAVPVMRWIGERIHQRR
jgi:DNA (cytosine-5)-methyltransferase 1